MLSKILSEGGLSLDRLASFHEVAEKGSITAAANGSASRQSLISRQISELETTFGTSLLRRDSRPHQLTEEGVHLAHLCREFFFGLNDCMGRWRDQECVVSIAAGESLLQWIVLPTIQSKPYFREKKVRFALRNLRTLDAVRAVVEGKADVALVRKDAVPAGLEQIGDFSFQYRLTIPNSLARTFGDAGDYGSLALLQALPLAILEGDGHLARVIQEEADSAGIRLDVRLECSSFTQVSEAIESMGLAGFLPQFAPKITGTIQVEVPELKRLNRSLTLAWLPRRARNRPEIERIIRELV